MKLIVVPKIRNIMLASLMITLGAGQAFPQKGSNIEDISIIGLKRTRPAAARQLLDKYLGIAAEDIVQDEIKALLIGTGIFEDIRISTEQGETGMVLRVEVSEKWSILPLPVFVATSDGITAGAALIDANAFGLTDKIFAVGLLLPAGWMASMAYVNVPTRQGEVGWTVSAFFSRQEKTDADADDRDMRRYGFDAATAGLEFNFPLVGPLKGAIGGIFQDRAVRRIDNALKEPESASAIGIQPSISTRSNAWNGVFLTEIAFSASYARYFSLGRPGYGALKLNAVYEYPVAQWLKLGFKGAAIWAPEAPAVFEEGADRVGLAILPSSYSARNLLGGTAGVELRIFRFPFGTLAGIANYQAGYTESPLWGERIDHGPAGGVRLYVAKVAVPALDVGMAYNVPTGLFKATFGIGMRM